jgi:anaerobic magnesium-protoporphyrin IX monomethyl ester cyclase
MGSPIDLVLVNPGDKREIYQGLGADVAAVEPPYWSAALAGFLRKEGVSVAIIDANALNYSAEETAAAVAALSPRLAAVIVYGNQPSASTQTMSAAGRICAAIHRTGACKVAIGGLHPTALPERTIREEAVDYLIAGEGPFTLKALVAALRDGGALDQVPGLWYWEGEGLRSTAPAPLLKSLDELLPRAAWDLLPMERYRAHNWHCFDHITERQPYAAIYTSLGCPYGCVFCCINALFGKRGIRYRSPAAVVDEIGFLVETYGVKNIKFIDEMFVLDERHYMGIVEGLIERGYDLNIWAYARVDTVKPQNLERMRKAGITWLALGIESANPDVREGASKAMRVKDIGRVVEQIQAAGIRVIGNYIFGLPDDTLETMQETLDMAVELNCEFANFYCAMAYPGSPLYTDAQREGWELPSTWAAFSQHGYDMQPLPTHALSAKQVVQFRDEAFHAYFSSDRYLDMVESRFGRPVRDHVVDISKNKLRRRLLET